MPYTCTVVQCSLTAILDLFSGKVLVKPKLPVLFLFGSFWFAHQCADNLTLYECIRYDKGNI